MIAEGGHAALWLAAALGLLAVWRRGEMLGPLSIAAALFALTAALGLAWSALAADFSLKIVDEHVHRLQPPAMRLAAMANSVPGLLLLGAVGAGAGCGALIAIGRPVVRAAVLMTALLVLTVMLDPFARQSVVPVEGMAMAWPPGLLMPALLGIATGVLAVAASLPFSRPPVWMAVAALVGVAATGAATFAPAMTAEAPARPGTTLRLGRLAAEVREVRPVAGPGYTAIEARVAVDGAELRPRHTTPVFGAERSDPVSARVGSGRVSADLGGDERLRLTWRLL